MRSGTERNSRKTGPPSPAICGRSLLWPSVPNRNNSIYLHVYLCIYINFFNPCRKIKRPEKRNTRKALVSYLGRVQLSSVRAEEEGAEEHYLKQKWRQNPPVRSILLPPPPPPAPLPHRGRREPSGVPATRGSRHRASPAQVGKRPFFTKKIKEAERKLPQLFLLADSSRGARPKSLRGENSTHKGLHRAGRRGGGAANGGGGGEGTGQSLPTSSLGPKEPRFRQPSHATTGKGGQSSPALGRETEETNPDPSALPCAGNPPGAGWKEELGCWAAGSRGKGALSGVRVPCPRPPPTFDPGAPAAAPPFSLRGPALPPSAARAPTPFPCLAHPSGPARLARTHTPRTQCPSPPSCRQPLLGSVEGGRRRRRRRRFSILARRAPGPACPRPALGRRKGAGAGRGAAFGALSLSHSRSARLPPPRRGAPGTGGGEAGGWSVFAARPRRPPSWLRAVPAASRPGAPHGPGRRGPRPGLSSPPRTAIPCPPAKLPEASPPFSNLPCPVSA